MFRFQLLISPVLLSFGNIFIGYEPSFTINGTVKTWNLQEFAPKRQHTEFIYAKNDGREKINVRACLCINGPVLVHKIFSGKGKDNNYLQMIKTILPSPNFKNISIISSIGASSIFNCFKTSSSILL